MSGQPIPKTRRITDPEHVLYVSRQAPMFRGLPESPSDPKDKAYPKSARRADPHHLPNYDHGRRHCDWFVVPLDREKHDWISTVYGKAWERANIVMLYQRAAKYMYANGRLDAKMYARVLKITDWIEMREWIREVLRAGQEAI